MMMLRGLQIVPANTRIDFVRLRWYAFVISAVLVFGSVLLIAVKGLDLGIDFEGGILMEVRTEGPADLAAMRAQLANLGIGEVSLQEFGGPREVLIRIQQQDEGEAGQARAIALVKETLGEGVEYRRTEFVGPTVGDELIRDAVIAVILATLGIMGYIWFRYEWQFGLNAIVALLHDVITTVGLFALTGLPFDLAIVAAVLTIAGYSVNDTVVVYDRIREELRRYKKKPMAEVINLALNKTLSRTTMTSGLTLLAVFALYLFGGETLRGFSLALIWGVVIGTYSTIFVATPMLIYMNLRRGAEPGTTGGTKSQEMPAGSSPGGGD